MLPHWPRSPARPIAHMQIVTVGGAVRDELLGLPVKDRDYVVVGVHPADMREQQ